MARQQEPKKIEKPRRTFHTEAELVEVAEMYYEEHFNQEDIGNKLARSRQDVARMLEAARLKGIVRIYVGPTTSPADLHELGHELQRKFACLKDALVVAGHPAMLSGYKAEVERAGVTFSLAESASAYLSRKLTNDSVIVVGKGQLVKATVNGVRLSKPIPDARIVPMSGFIRDERDPLDSNVIATDLQRVSGAKYHWLPIPAIVPPEVREIVQKLPIVSKTLSIMNDATVVITNMAYMSPGRIKFLGDIGFIGKDQVDAFLDHLSERPPVGEICGWCFDLNGNIDLPITWAPIGFGLVKMRKLVEEHKGYVIGVAGADSARFNAILGALNGRLINVLITDHITAQYLLRE